MAYTTIDNPRLFFNTVLYTGNTSGQSITGVGFQPDWLWIKSRSAAYQHSLRDSTRGSTKTLRSNGTNAEATQSDSVTSFDSDGFTLGADSSSFVNENSATYVGWNWLAGGTAPAITYFVKVVSDSGNKYRFNDFGTSAVTLDLQEGGTYTFDLSDSSNDGHPMKFSETSGGSHGGGSTYSTGVVYQLDGASVTESNYVSNFNSASSRKIIITVAASAPTLYYFCHYHSGMGGQANTNSTFGSSNFSGSIQSTVSASTDAGFSIVGYQGTGSNATIGHGLSSAPEIIFQKCRSNSSTWWHVGSTKISTGFNSYLHLNETDAVASDSSVWNNTNPTSSVFSVGSAAGTNGSSRTNIAYCFHSVKGYSKIGSYTGSGSTNGSYIHLGFKPAWTMYKRISSGGSGGWSIHDNKRSESNGNNPLRKYIVAQTSGTESTDDFFTIDHLSNGFKLRATDGESNASGVTYLYMAFAESPFVTGASGIPTTAR